MPSCSYCQNPLPEPIPPQCPNCGAFISSELAPPFEPPSDVPSEAGALPPPLPPSAPAPPPPPPPGGQAPGSDFPWDARDRLGFVTAFAETTLSVLTRPASFYRAMPVVGGLGSPLLYALIAGWLGLAAAALYQAIWISIVGPSMLPFGMERAEVRAALAYLESGMGLVAQVVFGGIWVVISIFIAAGVIGPGHGRGLALLLAGQRLLLIGEGFHACAGGVDCRVVGAAFRQLFHLRAERRHLVAVALHLVAQLLHARAHFGGGAPGILGAAQQDRVGHHVAAIPAAEPEEVAVQAAACGFDLASGHPARFQRLQTIFAEADLCTTQGFAPHSTAHLLTPLYTFWHQHSNYLIQRQLASGTPATRLRTHLQLSQPFLPFRV